MGTVDPDYPATWTPDVDGVVELVPDINGTSVKVKTLMPPEGDPFHAVTITYEADADLGDGVEAVMGSVTLTVFSPDAREDPLTVTLTPSEFTPIPVVEEDPPPATTSRTGPIAKHMQEHHSK
jgi:hypothetical protein